MYTEVSGGNLYYYNGTARTAKAVDSAIYIKNTKLTNGIQVYSSLSTSPQDVNIYIYYEGEDDNNASVNAVNISNLVVSVNFTTQHTN